MASLNKVILLGNIVADPELKQTQSGVPVCSFRIGVQRRFKDASGQYQSDFFDIVAWRQQAEFVTKFFKKGKPISIVGSLQQRSWTAQDGTKRYTVEVIADELNFVEKMDSGLSHEQRRAQAVAPDGRFEDLPPGDDLPF